MKLLIFDDYQLPVFACFLLFFAMLTYWLSLYLPKNNSIFLIARIFTFLSNILLSLTLLLRWINESYFPLSNLY
jgi:ABC-type transport system involved in cytochrome c biogenesis permease subunit